MKGLDLFVSVLWLFISVSFIIRGYIEYQLYMTFDEKDINLISRIVVMISSGITSLILFFLINFKNF
jgi:hypothetical protein